jgi:hypothetical protein
LKLNLWGANIHWPYIIPDVTTPDGYPGLWTLIGAVEAIEEEMEKNPSETGTGRPTMFLDCGESREDQK